MRKKELEEEADDKNNEISKLIQLREEQSQLLEPEENAYKALKRYSKVWNSIISFV